jgi:single-strand DNA-binding protein
MNLVLLTGNVGNDPEIINLENGTKLAKFSLATNISYKNKNGEKIDEVEWHRIICYGKTTDIVEKYISKGKKVLIKGKNKTRSWEDKEGKKNYITEVQADHIEFLSS